MFFLFFKVLSTANLYSKDFPPPPPPPADLLQKCLDGNAFTCYLKKKNNQTFDVKILKCCLNCSLIQRFNKTISQTVFNGWLAAKFLSFTIGMKNFLYSQTCFFLSASFSGSNSWKLPFGWFEEMSAFCCQNSPWKHGSTSCGSEIESKAMWNVLR